MCACVFGKGKQVNFSAAIDLRNSKTALLYICIYKKYPYTIEISIPPKIKCILKRRREDADYTTYWGNSDRQTTIEKNFKKKIKKVLTKGRGCGIII